MRYLVLVACANTTVTGDEANLHEVSSVRYRQELTYVMDGGDRPLNIANKLAAKMGGQARLDDEDDPNGRARIDSAAGKWIVSIDGEVPNVGAVVEVRTPKLGKEDIAPIVEMLNAMASEGTIMPEYGGGHLSLDHDRFLADPKFLSCMLLAYLDEEDDLISTYRHPVRQGNARAYSEAYHGHTDEIRADFSAFATLSADALPGAATAFIDKWELRREMAMNLMKVTGVIGGNKESKGMYELRLFNAPRTAAELTAHRDVMHGLLMRCWQ